ncbi:CD209 antigen-like protein E [Mastacembelus armatus]|uniref:CD209 antigen-like protein E n=1 Tax=Mastacembelus armatus TaxID=205130 RepID=A0A7N8XEC9_9TELE|nr:CD209 antigen-like protein E [Mastacembelus armatus]
MSCNIYEDPDLTMNVRYSKRVQEDREEIEVDIYERGDGFTGRHAGLSTQDGGANNQKHLPAKQRRSFKAAALVLSLLCLLLLVGITVLSRLYIPIFLENIQLRVNYERLKTINDNLIRRYCQLEGKGNQTQGKEEKGWILFHCSCYYKSNEVKNWEESRRDCQSRGADLVIINSKKEQDFVINLNSNESWIGLQSQKSQDWQKIWEWKWVDGTTPAYLAWKKEVKVNADNEFTAYIDGQGHWIHTKNGTKQWICEKQI